MILYKTLLINYTSCSESETFLTYYTVKNILNMKQGDIKTKTSRYFYKRTLSKLSSHCDVSSCCDMLF